MFASFSRPFAVLTRTRSPSTSIQTGETCGEPSSISSARKAKFVPVSSSRARSDSPAITEFVHEPCIGPIFGRDHVRREGAHQSRDGNPRRARGGRLDRLDREPCRARQAAPERRRDRDGRPDARGDARNAQHARADRPAGDDVRQQLRHPLALLPLALVLPHRAVRAQPRRPRPTPRRTAASPSSTTRTRSPSGCRRPATTPRSSAST